MEPNDYFDTAEAIRFLRISKATFYRVYYPRLIRNTTTMERDGHPLYLKSALQDLLRPVDHMVCENRRMHLKMINPKHSTNQSISPDHGQLTLDF